MTSERGFTLLEILAALAIAAIGIMAVVKTTHSAVELLQATEDRTLASWIASNRLAELRITRTWPSPVSTEFQREMGGRIWYTREEVSTTPDPDLLRIDLTVFHDKDSQHVSATLFGYLSRYSPPAAPEPAQNQAEEQSVEGVQSLEAISGETAVPANGAGDEEAQ